MQQMKRASWRPVASSRAVNRLCHALWLYSCLNYTINKRILDTCRLGRYGVRDLGGEADFIFFAFYFLCRVVSQGVVRVGVIFVVE